MPIPEPHPQLLGLLDDARDNPDDDTPRLILADWLEEHDHVDLAEIVRAGVQRGQAEESALEESISLAQPRSLPNEWLERLQQTGLTCRFDRGLLRVQGDLALFENWNDPLLFPWIESLTLETDGVSFAGPPFLPLLREVNSLAVVPTFSRGQGAVSLFLPQQNGELLRVLLRQLTPRRLRKLLLGNCAVGMDYLRELSAWPGAEELTHLNLAGCALTSEQVTLLCHSAMLTKIRWLDLRDNQLGDRTASLVIQSIRNQAVESLFLGGNALGPQTLSRLAESRCLEALLDLHLAHNYLDEPTLLVLVNGFRSCPGMINLKRLDLSFNPIPTRVLEGLATLPTLGQLVELNLTNGTVDSVGLRSLVDSSNLKNLRRLHLGGNPLDQRAMRILAGSPMIRQLSTLDLHSCRLRDDAMSILLEAAPLPNLLWLRLGGNYLSRGTRRELVAAFPFADFGP
jgi:uncharacterized protein (TIGR02996 family)